MRILALVIAVLASPVLAEEVALKTTDLDGVLKAVAAEKGKVVVVDVWGTF